VRLSPALAGRELALKLADKGYRVFGTALNPAEVDELATRIGRAGDVVGHR
jgi:hypothetical protein